VVDLGVTCENLVYADYVLGNLHIKEKSLELERQVGNNMMNYPVGDFLIRVKNAGMGSLKEVRMQNTKFVKEVAEALKVEGFLDKVTKDGKDIIVTLSYKSKKPVLKNLKLVSKPGLRIYLGVNDMKNRKRRSSIFILSTPSGVLSSTKAVKKMVGGEVIVEVW